MNYARGLGLESLGQLNYLRALLAQPPGEWKGFYTPLSPSMNFALRYQLAFGAYAVALLSTHTPAYRAPYAEAIRGAIERMLDVAAWGYWRAPSSDAAASGGHVAVLLSPHRARPTGPPSDPIAQDNLQYSGHLATLLGLYEKVSGDTYYDSPFTLADPSSGAAYTYTHGEVAARIYAQMRENYFGGVCCESGMAYVPCNNHALASNALHDAIHGTRYSDANASWLKSVREKMVLKGPALRGVFGAAFVKDLHAAAPVAFNFTDAWGLALMFPFEPSLVKRLYRRLRKRLTRAGDGLAYLDSSATSERLEISDVALNTGFALIAARAAGDMSMASAMEAYAREFFNAGWDGAKFFHRGALRSAHASALYALAGAVEPGGENYARLFAGPLRPRPLDEPFVAEVTPNDGTVGVAAAEYDPEARVLRCVLRRVGDPADNGGGPVKVSLSLGNAGTASVVEVDGAPLEAGRVTRTGAGEVVVSLGVPPGRTVECLVRF